MKESRYFKVKIPATASFGLLVAYLDSFLDFPFFSHSLSISILIHHLSNYCKVYVILEWNKNR